MADGDIIVEADWSVPSYVLVDVIMPALQVIEVATERVQIVELTTGIVGAKGDPGPTGPMGPQGPQGEIGPQGETGPEGPIGPQGIQGPIGPQGIQGVQGVEGPQGETGPKGDKGDQGDIGPQGPMGNSSWGSITGILSQQTDLQTALDAKVSKAGDFMTGAFKIADGTVAAPGLAFNSEAGLGMFRPGAGRIGWASNDQKVVEFNTAAGANSYLVLNPRAAGTSTIQMWSDASPTANTDHFSIDKRPDGAHIYSGVTGTGAVKPLFFEGFPSATFDKMPVYIKQVSGGNATLILDHTPAAQASDIYGFYNGLSQWLLRLGSGGAANNFSLDRYDNAGAALGAALTIDRLAGTATFGAGVVASNFTVTGTANSAWYQDASQVVFQFAANNYFNLNKANGDITLYRGSGQWTRFSPTSGDLVNYGSVFAGGDTSLGLISNGSFPYIRWAADNWRLQFNRGNGDLAYINQAGTSLFSIGGDGTATHLGNIITNANTGVAGAINLNNNGWIRFHQPGVGIKYLRTDGNYFQVLNQAATAAILNCSDAGRLEMSRGYLCKNGAGGTFGANTFNWMWNGANMYCFVDDTNQGYVTFTSDERIKRDIAPLESSEEAFMKLAPISYRWVNDEVRTDTSLHHGLSAQNVRASLGASTTLGDFEDDPTPREGHVSFPAGVDDRAVIAHVILRVQDLINRIAALEAV